MVIDDNQPSHISILIKFERVNRMHRALHCLAGLACLIFWFTHHGPRWPISVEKQREASFFGRNWPPGPMMGDPKNQGCQTRQTMKSTIPSVHSFKFDQMKIDTRDG